MRQTVRLRAAVFAAVVGALLFALAATASQPAEDVAVLDPPAKTPPDFEPSQMPLVDGRGADELRKVLRDQEARAEGRERFLASPQGEAERAASQTAFVGLSDAAAMKLFEDEFAGALEELGAGQGPLDLVGDRSIKANAAPLGELWALHP